MREIGISEGMTISEVNSKMDHLGFKCEKDTAKQLFIQQSNEYDVLCSKKLIIGPMVSDSFRFIIELLPSRKFYEVLPKDNNGKTMINMSEILTINDDVLTSIRPEVRFSSERVRK